MSQENSEMALSIYAKATGDQKLVGLALEHLNDSAGSAAMNVSFFGGIVDECEDGDFKRTLEQDHYALSAGRIASNSNGGRLLQDYRINSHKIYDGTEKKHGGSFLSGLLGKKDNNGGGGR